MLHVHQRARIADLREALQRLSLRQVGVAVAALRVQRRSDEEEQEEQQAESPEV